MSHPTSLPLLLLLSAMLACTGAKPPKVTSDERPSADTGAIRSLEQQLRQAIVAGDTATLARLWAPEYQSTSAVGHTSDRAQSLMAYGAGLVNVDTAVIREVQIRPYGTTALSTGYMDWAGSAVGRPFGGTVRFQHLWVATGGGWQLVTSQLTNQAPPAAGNPPEPQPPRPDR